VALDVDVGVVGDVEHDLDDLAPVNSKRYGYEVEPALVPVDVLLRGMVGAWLAPGRTTGTRGPVRSRVADVEVDLALGLLRHVRLLPVTRPHGVREGVSALHPHRVRTAHPRRVQGGPGGAR
jgi:hypothetical protein